MRFSRLLLAVLGLSACGGNSISVASNGGAGGASANGASAGRSSIGGGSVGGGNVDSAGEGSVAPANPFGAAGTGPNEPGPGTAAPDFAHCPPAAPTPGTACDHLASLCRYGDDARVECRPVLRCTNSGWQLAVAPCEALPADACPATQPAPSAACTPLQTNGAPSGGDGRFACVYSGVDYCVCRICPFKECAKGPGWECSKPPAATCPESAPNFGTPCTSDALACRYGDPCASGTTLICKSGVWTPLSASCAE